MDLGQLRLLARLNVSLYDSVASCNEHSLVVSLWSNYLDEF